MMAITLRRHNCKTRQSHMKEKVKDNSIRQRRDVSIIPIITLNSPRVCSAVIITKRNTKNESRQFSVGLKGKSGCNLCFCSSVTTLNKGQRSSTFLYDFIYIKLNELKFLDYVQKYIFGNCQLCPFLSDLRQQLHEKETNPQHLWSH